MNPTQIILAVGGLALLFFWWRRSGGAVSDAVSSTSGTPGSQAVSPVTLNVTGPRFADSGFTDELGLAVQSGALGFLASSDSGAGQGATPTFNPNSGGTQPQPQ